MNTRKPFSVLAVVCLFTFSLTPMRVSYASSMNGNKIIIDDYLPLSPGDYSTYYTQENLGKVKDVYGVFVKDITSQWALASSYSYGRQDNFTTGVSLSYKDINAYGEFSSSFSVTTTVPADSSRYSKLSVFCDFRIEKIRLTKHSNGKIESTSIFYRSVPITNTTKIKPRYL